MNEKKENKKELKRKKKGGSSRKCVIESHHVGFLPSDVHFFFSQFLLGAYISVTLGIGHVNVSNISITDVTTSVIVGHGLALESDCRLLL